MLGCLYGEQLLQQLWRTELRGGRHSPPLASWHPPWQSSSCPVLYILSYQGPGRLVLWSSSLNHTCLGPSRCPGPCFPCPAAPWPCSCPPHRQWGSSHCLSLSPPGPGHHPFRIRAGVQITSCDLHPCDRVGIAVTVFVTFSCWICLR